MRVAALVQDRLGAVPGAARARAVEAPVALAVEIPEDAVLVGEHRSGLHRSSAWSGRRPARTTAGRSAGRASACGPRRSSSSTFSKLSRGQILVGVVPDQHHRRVDAGAEALDLLPGEIAVGGDVQRIVMDAALADVEDRLRAAQHAGRGAADLHVRLASRTAAAGTWCRRSRPRARGCAPCRACRRRARIAASGSQPPCCSCARHSSGMIADCWRPAGYFAICFFAHASILRREGKTPSAACSGGARRRTDIQRSTSPNTMSSEPRMAETSASMWPRQRKSIACRCAKPGARILHL